MFLTDEAYPPLEFARLLASTLTQDMLMQILPEVSAYNHDLEEVAIDIQRRLNAVNDDEEYDEKFDEMVKHFAMFLVDHFTQQLQPVTVQF